MLQSASHQIVQSPARLGLSNPNSPAVQSPGASKLSSQKPSSSSQQPPQQSILLPSKPISPALLSILPPLPRAQALLLQMASLASKLFDASPNRSSWLSSFRGSLPTFLPAQVNSMAVPPLDSSPTTTKDILAVFASLQTQLFEAVAELQEMLDLQAARQKLIEEIQFNESAIVAFTNKLREAERVLDMLVDDYADYRRPNDGKSEEDDEGSLCTTTITSCLNLSDILSYAHKISYTTFAPPEFGAGQAPLRGALPPAPQEEQMRASQLYNFADIDVGLPRVAEKKDKVVDPLMDGILPASLVDANTLADLALQGLITPNIMVPQGWKPGMPVELPRDMLPLPPPGWKPGDPVQLSQLESLPFPAGREDYHLPTPPMGGRFTFEASDPIQVGNVKLDIDMTSSEEGSSDDDD